MESGAVKWIDNKIEALRNYKSLSTSLSEVSKKEEPIKTKKHNRPKEEGKGDKIDIFI